MGSNMLEPVDQKLLEYGQNHVDDRDISLIADVHNVIRELLGKPKVNVTQ